MYCGKKFSLRTHRLVASQQSGLVASQQVTLWKFYSPRRIKFSCFRLKIIWSMIHQDDPSSIKGERSLHPSSRAKGPIIHHHGQKFPSSIIMGKSSHHHQGRKVPTSIITGERSHHHHGRKVLSSIIMGKSSHHHHGRKVPTIRVHREFSKSKKFQKLNYNSWKELKININSCKQLKYQKTYFQFLENLEKLSSKSSFSVSNTRHSMPTDGVIHSVRLKSLFGPLRPQEQNAVALIP